MSKQCWECKGYKSEFRSCANCEYKACDSCWKYSSSCPKCHQSRMTQERV